MAPKSNNQSVKTHKLVSKKVSCVSQSQIVAEICQFKKVLFLNIQNEIAPKWLTSCVKKLTQQVPIVYSFNQTIDPISPTPQYENSPPQKPRKTHATCVQECIYRCLCGGTKNATLG